MTIDVVCAGTVYLDLTFEGLDELPSPGRERFARELHATPGGAAIVAVGLARLGARAAVVAPLGRDLAGRMLRELLDAEGIVCAGGSTARTPVTVALPVGGDRALATYEPSVEIDAHHISRLRPRAVVVDLDRLELVPDGAEAYAAVGDAAAERYAGRLPATVAATRALVANRSEACRLTGTENAEDAVLALAETAPTAVVTCDAEGALAAADGELVSAPAPSVDVADTTGAGDLLTAAYVWGDLAGLPLRERLRRAVVYAALSVRTATGAGSAATLEELERALAELDPELAQESTAREAP